MADRLLVPCRPKCAVTHHKHLYLGARQRRHRRLRRRFGPSPAPFLAPSPVRRLPCARSARFRAVRRARRRWPTAPAHGHGAACPPSGPKSAVTRRSPCSCSTTWWLSLSLSPAASTFSNRASPNHRVFVFCQCVMVVWALSTTFGTFRRVRVSTYTSARIHFLTLQPTRAHSVSRCTSRTDTRLKRHLPWLQ